MQHLARRSEVMIEVDDFHNFAVATTKVAWWWHTITRLSKGRLSTLQLHMTMEVLLVCCNSCLRNMEYSMIELHDVLYGDNF